MKTSEVEAFPSKGQHFTPAKDRGAVFLSEDEVLSEAELVEGRAPVRGYPMGSKEKKLHLDAMNDDPDKVSDKSTPFAKEAGIRTELVQQDAAARKQIEERKKEEEFKQIRQALPDQSLNISGQERRLKELSEERHRVGKQIQGGRGGGGDGKEGEGGWGGGVGRNGRESEGGNVPQRKKHTYELLPGEHQGDVLPHGHQHNRPPDTKYPPPNQAATEFQQNRDSRNGAHHQGVSAGSSHGGPQESTGGPFGSQQIESSQPPQSPNQHRNRSNHQGLPSRSSQSAGPQQVSIFIPSSCILSSLHPGI